MTRSHPQARKHRCPGGCRSMVEYDRVACYPCWWRLPIEYRKNINDTYKNRDNVPSAWHQAHAEAAAWYKANPAGARP